MQLRQEILLSLLIKLARNSLVQMLLATALAAATGYAFWILSAVTHPLLPAQSSENSWTVVPGTDDQLSPSTGSTRLTVHEKEYSLEYSFSLNADKPYPFAHLGIWFARGKDIEALKNWSRYDSITLTVRCEPRNVLVFILQTFDERVTTFDDFQSFRPSHGLFTCSQEWETITIPFDELITPEWWLQQEELEITDRAYDPTKIKSFALGNTSQSPKGIETRVKIAEMTLHGRNRNLFYGGATGLGSLWLAMMYVITRSRARRLLAEQQERAKIASLQQSYQPLSSDSKKSQERRALMSLMTTEFADPDLSLEMAISRLGINRTKLNTTLKEETGMTFSACLNHLRLTEAARLLAETDQSVAEIAFRVGYNNASYFNRVFRKTYHCTPSEFKQQRKVMDANLPEPPDTP